MSSEIMLTIGCITYNHEAYIKEAIESFLMQKCDFKYEIIIHDDASTDRTAEIIKKYEKIYPDKIRGIYQVENQYSKGIMTSQIVREQAKGKYIAFCEGDDFWTDENKIAEQVRFLENNPEYIATGHWCEIVNQNGEKSLQYPNGEQLFKYKKNEYSLMEYKKNIIPCHVNTIMHRNIFKDKKYTEIYKASKLVGDRTTILILTVLGKFYIENKVMSAYRYVIDIEGSYSSRIQGQNRCYEWYCYYENLEMYINEIMGKQINLGALKYEQLLTAMAIYSKKRNSENKKIVIEILKKTNKIQLIKYIPLALRNKMRTRN